MISSILLGSQYTDIKADNVFFDGPDTKTLADDLAANPPDIESYIELGGVEYPIMRPKPLPLLLKWDDEPSLVELYGVYLGDFSHGTLSIHNPSIFYLGFRSLIISLAIWAEQERKMSVVDSELLRAPEVILQAGYGTEIDIWAVGCTVRIPLNKSFSKLSYIYGFGRFLSY